MHVEMWGSCVVREFLFMTTPRSGSSCQGRRRFRDRRTFAASRAAKRFCICFGLSRSLAHTSCFEMPASPAHGTAVSWSTQGHHSEAHHAIRILRDMEPGTRGAAQRISCDARPKYQT